MQIERLGDAALLMTAGEGADEAAEVRRLAGALRAKPLPGVTDIVPSYRTVAVHYDLSILGPGAYGAVRKWAEGRARAGDAKEPLRVREVTIPVCYGGAFGPDLEVVAAFANVTFEEVIRLHSTGCYEVRAVGFMPGFGYLAGLDPRLAAPRRATPRIRVPAGSVGIAGRQTGVYPFESPGGWQIIGRTPMRMFRPGARRASVLQVGDVVRFSAISAAEFGALDKELGR